ncbi:probable methyltransferase TARBP1 [Mya arenaria]|uniref:probable methyltransferase TARBP1 n=1 Tax=Mya arenaria TaxID=6604 RepID=UPI0022E89D67|nr:probable methyltransferase TARBP1 [Mya arenaria]
MDTDDFLKTIVINSNFDLKETLSKLVSATESRLKAGFQQADINLYIHELATINQVLISGEGFFNKENKNYLITTSDRIIGNICEPLVQSVLPSTDSGTNLQVLLGVLGQLYSQCALVDEETLKNALCRLEGHINIFLNEKLSKSNFESDKGLVDFRTVIEVLKYIVSAVCKRPDFKWTKEQNEKLDALFEKLVTSLDILTVNVIGTLCIPVLLKILKINEISYTENVRKVWSQILLFSTSSVEDKRKPFILLCGFANQFFPVDGNVCNLDIRRDTQFWTILQAGLHSKDSLNRKRALYLLKRIVDICERDGADVSSEGDSGSGQHVGHSEGRHPVFWWERGQSKALSKVWEDFILLAEVLEEKQVHVIKPLLPRMDTLLKACTLPKETGRALLHTSWLKVVLLRCSLHESLQVIRWGANTALALDVRHCPVIEQGFLKYLSGEMLLSLREPKLYVREVGSGTGSMPQIAERLVTFFQGCWHALPSSHRGVYFCGTVETLCGGDWGPIPLLFTLRALAALPPAPCLDANTLRATRKWLTADLVSMYSFYRGMIQVFFVKILTKLIDKTLVPLEEVLQILSLVGRDECLVRGSVVWQDCVQFLAQPVEDDTSGWSGRGIKMYIHKILKQYLETSIDSKYSTADSVPALTVARLVMLTSTDTMATKMEESPCKTVAEVCEQVISVVNSINSHVYMSPHLADKALLLLNMLADEMGLSAWSSDDPVSVILQGTVDRCKGEMVRYISTQIIQGCTQMGDVWRIQLYMDSVSMLGKAGGGHPGQGADLYRLLETCITPFLNLQFTQSSGLHEKLQQLGCMGVLGTVANFLSNSPATQACSDLIGQLSDFMKKWKIITNFNKPTMDISVNKQEWGKFSSQFLTSQWQVVQLVLDRSCGPCLDIQELLPLAREALTVGVEETAIVVLKCLKLAISKNTVGEEALCDILDGSWMCLQGARRTITFWDVLDAFTCLAFHPALLVSPKNSPVIAKLNIYAEGLLELGQDKNGVVNAMCDQLYAGLTGPGMIINASKFVPLIVQLCMFGNLVQRCVRQVYDICAALEMTREHCPDNPRLNIVKNEDIEVKVKVISLLCHLDPSDPSHCHLATSVVKECLKKYVAVSKGSANRFSNSLVHRQRHRLIQTVLLLQGLVTKDYVDELWAEMWVSLEVETQPSVRHILEWVIIWALHRHQHLRLQLWSIFDKYRNTKHLTMSSLLCIVIHLGPKLPKEEQEVFYRQALGNVLPWCMAHHFQTRLYSQAVLSKLWAQAGRLGLTAIHTANPILQTIVDFNQENRNSTKNVRKLLDSFFFKFLDFKDDFSLETLYKVMPQMTGLSEEDWIAPELFPMTCPAWALGSGPTFINIRNPPNQFDKCDPSLWKYTTLKLAEAEVEEGGGERDVQKKIMPWRQMLLEEEVVSEVDHGVKVGPTDGLVVVTSLINKVPNLGGLCRTSEIFGVSEYVLGKLQYVEDTSFQGLSVTAHKWIPITEVHETDLSDYLQQRRQAGYTLVGVEQTANSVSLTDYTFPTKTLLLLGNEKEGIPVDLISQLDVCVEIPQQGVIRSLNVHVSGAILIWEYRRQQLMKETSSSS